MKRIDIPALFQKMQDGRKITIRKLMRAIRRSVSLGQEIDGDKLIELYLYVMSFRSKEWITGFELAWGKINAGGQYLKYGELYKLRIATQAAINGLGWRAGGYEKFQRFLWQEFPLPISRYSTKRKRLAVS